MILYTVVGNVGQERYLDLAESGDITGKNVYVNITNRCPCSCVFCLRQTKQMADNNTLWLKGNEPSVETVLNLLSNYDLSVIHELVFCGFGEPFERMDDMYQIIDAMKPFYSDLKIRVNTIGLANLIYGREITPGLNGRIDTVSISLNAPSDEGFFALTSSKFGLKS